MAPADLEARLRAAMAVPPEPSPSVLADEVVAALPRYRARRRRVLTSGGIGVLATAGLVAGLVASLGGSAPVTTASRPPVPRCVEVAVGSERASCAGSVSHGAAATQSPSAASGAAAPLATSNTEFGPSERTSAIPVPAGHAVTVTLPPGVAWHRVTLTETAPTGLGGTSERQLQTRLDRTTGQTLVRVGRRPAGGFVVVATGTRSCRGTPSCAAQAERWSATFNVT